MRFKGSLILFALALALGLYYVFFEWPAHKREAAMRERPLTPIALRDVDRLKITRPEGTIEFRVSGTHWDMVAPLSDVANQPAVTTLLAAVAAAKVEGSIGPQDDPAPFGLDHPIDLALWSEDGDSLRLRIGGYTVDRSYVYATLPPRDDVLLVPTTLHRYASAAVEDFRDPHVVTFDLSVAEGYELAARGRKTLRWERSRDSDRWFTAVGADSIEGDRVRVESVLRRLRGLRVRRFLDADEAAELSRSDVRTATIDKRDSTRVVVSFLCGGPEVYADVSGRHRVVEVDSTVTELFTLTVADLRDKHLLRFDTRLVERVELATSDTLATLVRSGNAWTYPNPAMGTMDPARVATFLDAARALEAARVVDEHAFPTDRGVTFRLALFDGGANIIDELLCRPRGGDENTVLATSRSAGFTAELESDRLAHLVSLLRRTPKR